MKQIIKLEIEKSFREDCDWQIYRPAVTISCEATEELIVKTWRGGFEESDDDSLALHIADCPDCFQALIHTFPTKSSTAQVAATCA